MSDLLQGPPIKVNKPLHTESVEKALHVSFELRGCLFSVGKAFLTTSELRGCLFEYFSMYQSGIDHNS
jgi:hypothetical protein